MNNSVPPSAWISANPNANGVNGVDFTIVVALADKDRDGRMSGAEAPASVAGLFPVSHTRPQSPARSPAGIGYQHVVLLSQIGNERSSPQEASGLFGGAAARTDPAGRVATDDNRQRTGFMLWRRA